MELHLTWQRLLLQKGAVSGGGRPCPPRLGRAGEPGCDGGSCGGGQAGRGFPRGRGRSSGNPARWLEKELLGRRAPVRDGP